jgi:hypothetical protein
LAVFIVRNYCLVAGDQKHGVGKGANTMPKIVRITQAFEIDTRDTS